MEATYESKGEIPSQTGKMPKGSDDFQLVMKKVNRWKEERTFEIGTLFLARVSERAKIVGAFRHFASLAGNSPFDSYVASIASGSW